MPEPQLARARSQRQIQKQAQITVQGRAGLETPASPTDRGRGRRTRQALVGVLSSSPLPSHLRGITLPQKKGGWMEKKKRRQRSLKKHR
jgi:hypothetical protein